MCREWRSLMGREVFLRIMQLGKEKGKDRLIFHISFYIFHFPFGPRRSRARPSSLDYQATLITEPGAKRLPPTERDAAVAPLLVL